jgi:hypothetical protein
VDADDHDDDHGADHDDHGSQAVASTAMATERFEHTLGDADTLMWHIDRDPHLRSTIVTALVLDRAPEWSEVVARLERGSRLVPRLRQRVVEPPFRIGPPAWSADPDFDLSYHLRRVRAPKPRSFDAVLDIAATAAMGDFDRARPLWERDCRTDAPRWCSRCTTR